jgi:hypothetical protein
MSIIKSWADGSWEWWKDLSWDTYIPTIIANVATIQVMYYDYEYKKLDTIQYKVKVSSHDYTYDIDEDNIIVRQKATEDLYSTSNIRIKVRKVKIIKTLLN